MKPTGETSPLREEFDKAFRSHVASVERGYEHTPKTTALWAARWAFERAAKYSEDPDINNGTHFKCGDIIAREIRQLSQELS